MKPNNKNIRIQVCSGKPWFAGLSGKLSLVLCLLFFTGMSLEIYAQAQDVRKLFNTGRRTYNKTRRTVKRVERAIGSKKRKVDPATDTTNVIIWEKEPYIPNGGMIRDYEHVYTFFHKTQEETFLLDPDTRSIGLDTITNQYYKNIGGTAKVDDQFVVMGWHPYWMEDAYLYYDYNLLSIVSYYSYEINPYSGGYSNLDIIDQLKNSTLVDSASRYGTKVFLSVTSFGQVNNDTFLSNGMATEHFLYQIMNLLRSTGLSGIDLNFEEIASHNQEDFIHFVKEVYARLKAEDFELIINVPYFNDRGILNYNELRGHCTYFNIMGYDFSGEHSAYPGSIAPLQNTPNQPSLITAVNDLLNAGVVGQQIILSLPLYGVSWDISDKILYYEQSIPYYKVISNYDTEYVPYYDALSSSFFYMIEGEGFKRVCWFENGTSLDLKFQWAKDRGLKGVGLWALGYDQRADEIWDAVAKNFQADTLVLTTPIESKLSGPYGVVKDIIRYKKVIGLAFLVFAGFIVVGFVLSLTDWRVRDVLFKKQSFRLVYAVLVITLILFSVKWWWWDDRSWDLIFGVGIGAVTIILVNGLFIWYRKSLR